jgi:hypothetical protein
MTSTLLTGRRIVTLLQKRRYEGFLEIEILFTLNNLDAANKT